MRGLFGGSASRLRVPAARATRIDDSLGERGILLALAWSLVLRQLGRPELVDEAALEPAHDDGLESRLLSRA